MGGRWCYSPLADEDEGTKAERSELTVQDHTAGSGGAGTKTRPI